MHVPIAVCIGDLCVVYFGKPVVGGYRAAVGKDKASDGIGSGGVFLQAKRLGTHVVVYGFLVVQYGGFKVSELFTLAAVQYVGLCHIGIACMYQHLLGAVLNVLYRYQVVFYFRVEIRGHLKCEEINLVAVAIFFHGVKSLGYCPAYLGDVEFRYGVVSL